MILFFFIFFKLWNLFIYYTVFSEIVPLFRNTSVLLNLVKMLFTDLEECAVKEVKVVKSKFSQTFNIVFLQKVQSIWFQVKNN